MDGRESEKVSNGLVGGVEAFVPVSASRSQFSVSEIDETHTNEAISRFIAYTSPYLFWIVVSGLSAGLLLFQL